MTVETLKAITDFFADIWQVFTIQHPVIGIPFSIIYLGIFAIGFSIMLLKPLLGIGYGVVSNVSRSARGIKAKSVTNRRNRREKNESTN